MLALKNGTLRSLTQKRVLCVQRDETKEICIMTSLNHFISDIYGDPDMMWSFYYKYNLEI